MNFLEKLVTIRGEETRKFAYSIQDIIPTDLTSYYNNLISSFSNIYNDLKQLLTYQENSLQRFKENLRTVKTQRIATSSQLL